MDKIKLQLVELGLALIDALKIGIVYLLPAYLVTLFANDAKYGVLTNVLMVILTSRIKKAYPDSEPIQKIL